MKITLLIFSLLLFGAWAYSGMLNANVESMDGQYLTLDNGSRWEIYAEDLYRAAKWEKGDAVKLIRSEGFYLYDWLILNRTLEDAVHGRCETDTNKGAGN